MMISTQIATEMSTPRVTISKKEIAITTQILKNKPNVDKAFAGKLAKLIHKYATAFKADPNRAVAIAMLESGYKSTVHKNSNKTVDIGIFQINTRTAKYYKMDIKKLIDDYEYSTQAYFTVMRDKIKMCNSLKTEAWQCYHSRNKKLRRKYKLMVNKYYANN